MIKTNENYLPNLNGLRFFAALIIIIQHIEQLKYLFGLGSYWLTIPFMPKIGELSVVFFFVLSGFLITYLLLNEEKKTGEINVRKFYIRRLLRIAPLYYLVIFLAFAFLPYFELFQLPGSSLDKINDHLLGKLLLYGFFFSNLVMPVFGVVPFAAPTWSIGTEEQFYLIWPVLIKKFKRNRVRIIFSVIGFYIMVKVTLASSIFADSNWVNPVINYWNAFKIDCLSIGALLAVFLTQKNKILLYLVRKDLFYLVLVGLPILVLCDFEIPFFNYDFYAILFGIIILNFATQQNLYFSLENKLLNYLGKISYGLYLWHMISITITIKICMALGIVSNWIIYPVATILSVGLAGLSYQYYESYFLKIKSKFKP